MADNKLGFRNPFSFSNIPFTKYLSNQNTNLLTAAQKNNIEVLHLLEYSKIST